MNENPLCTEAESYSHAILLRSVHGVLALLSAVFFALSIWVFSNRRLRTVSMHRNLKILLVNVFVLYSLVAAVVAVAFTRIQVHYWTHIQPCDLLVPTWMSVAVRAPMFLYVAAFPLFHLAVTVERFLATMRADNYETSSSNYGILASLVAWLLSVSYIMYLVLLAFSDDDYFHSAHYYILTMKTNADVIITAHWFFLALDATTCIVDIALIFVNRRRIGRITPAYSLSRSYQVVENIRVTVYLIVPLDICNTLLYAIYLTTTTISRYYFKISVLPREQFNAIVDGAYSLLLLQTVISMGVFIYFCKRSKKPPVMVNSGADPDVYFELFNRQIA